MPMPMPLSPGPGPLAPRRSARLASGLAMAAVLVVLSAGGAGVAHAQLGEVELDQGATSELYIRKRPAAPTTPAIPPELESLLTSKEKQRNAKRLEAIGLLRQFLATTPTGDGRAEGLFKLAELLWEEARRTFILAIDRYERQLEACRQKRDSCKGKPKEPRLDLEEPAAMGDLGLGGPVGHGGW